jgi:hypothetical protein
MVEPPVEPALAVAADVQESPSLGVGEEAAA